MANACKGNSPNSQLPYNYKYQFGNFEYSRLLHPIQFLSMPPETSQFESSEMLATFLASTRLPEDSWRLCTRAVSAPQGFVAERVGQIAFFAFSRVWETGGDFMVELEGEGEGRGIFAQFPCRLDADEPPMVHAGSLRRFISLHAARCFERKLQELLNHCQSVVFTGHGLGGAIASLSTLWFLANFQAVSPSTPVFCITFGSPMLGNGSFSKAILQQRWGGNFCHVVAHRDSLSTHFISPCQNEKVVCDGGLSYWPFGSYMFCTEKGAICLDNPGAIVKFLVDIFGRDSTGLCGEEHLDYDDVVGKVLRQYLLKKDLERRDLPESSSEAGIALALQSSGISFQESAYKQASNYLLKARQLGWKRNLNNARMAVCLSKINPLRAELELYKAYCDNFHDSLGYYDSFKQRGASRRDFKVKMNMEKLGRFWDDLIDKIQHNHLTPDFERMTKYVNASQFYKLLVEPLEIAEYYRTGKHLKKGHYIAHGRANRFEIFDKWWGERKVGDEEGKPRSNYASLTQDSCFWARVEEARDMVSRVMGETNSGRRLAMLERIEWFERYVGGMVERMEVSVDVFAKNSSYSLFREEWKRVKCEVDCLGFEDKMVEGEM